jgi:hypothetical protein
MTIANPLSATTTAQSILATIKPAVGNAAAAAASAFVAGLAANAPTPDELTVTTYAFQTLATAPVAPYVLTVPAAQVAEDVADANGILQQIAAGHQMEFTATLSRIMSTVQAQLDPVLTALESAAVQAAIVALLAPK